MSTALDELRLAPTPTPLVGVAVLSGCAEAASADVLVSAAIVPKTLRVRAFSPAAAALSKPQRRSTYADAVAGASQAAAAMAATAAAGGVLRAGWLAKRTESVPAVLTVFTTSAPAGDPWRAVEGELCAYIDAQRPALRARGVRLVAVVVMAQGETAQGMDERLVSLRRRAELDPRQLVLCSCRPERSFTNAEALLADTARAHYKEETRRKKALLRSLPKGAAPALHARLAFKAAYLSEFRRDFKQALKYYRDAYGVLAEMRAAEEARRMPESLALHEVKAVADLVNFRICAILFNEYKNLGEAVAQFSRHVRLYKGSVAISAMEFLHWGWVASQHEAFAQLLESNPNAVFKERGAFHPSFYLQAAAHYTLQRKKFAQRQCSAYLGVSGVIVAREVLKALPTSNPSIFSSRPAFLGQFQKWRTQDSDLGEDACRVVAWETYFFDHTSAVLRLLTRARTSLQSLPNVSRLLLSLDTEIAMQLAEQKQWEKAKQYCDAIAPRYKQEKWFDLLTQIEEVARLCSLRLGDTKEFFSHSFDLMAPGSALPQASRQQIQAELEEILHKQSPSEEEEAPSETQPPIGPLHASAVSLLAPISFSLSRHSVLLHMNAKFSRSISSVLEPVALSVEITSLFPARVQFSELHIAFDYPQCNSSRLHDPSGDPASDLTFWPNIPRTFEVPIVPSRVCEIECTAVTLCWGNQPSQIKFVWDLFALARQKEKSIEEIGAVSFSAGKHVSLTVVEREPKLKLRSVHCAPAMHGEIYRYTVQITNEDSAAIESGKVFFESLPRHDRVFFSDPLGSVPQPEATQIGPIPVGGKIDVTVYVMVGVNPERQVTTRVIYQSGDADCTTTAILQDWFPAQAPFYASFSFYTKDLELANPQNVPLAAGCPFFLCVAVQPTTPFPLAICETRLDIDPQSSIDLLGVSDHEVVKRKVVVLSKTAKHAIWYSLRLGPSQAGADSVPLGTFNLSCTRVESDGTSVGQPLAVQVTVPKIRVAGSPLTVERVTSPTGSQWLPIADKLIVRNALPQPQELMITVEESAGFMVSGNTRAVVSVPPFDSLRMDFLFVPLGVGHFALPQLVVSQGDKRIPCPQRSVFVHPFPRQQKSP